MKISDINYKNVLKIQMKLEIVQEKKLDVEAMKKINSCYYQINIKIYVNNLI